MTDESSVYTGLSEVALEIREMYGSLEKGLEELAAAAECITARQLYQAAVLHAVVSRFPIQGIDQLVDRPVAIAGVVELAHQIASAMVYRELEELKRDQA